MRLLIWALVVLLTECVAGYAHATLLGAPGHRRLSPAVRRGQAFVRRQGSGAAEGGSAILPPSGMASAPAPPPAGGTSTVSIMTLVPPAPSASSTMAEAGVALPTPPATPPASPPPPVPRIFDALGAIKETSCVGFLSGLSSSENMTACLPFSLLLTSSGAFSNAGRVASKNATEAAHVNGLIAYSVSPAPGADACDTYFQGLSKAVAKGSNCGQDIAVGAAMAQSGFGNYQVMRHAAALTDPDSGVYCYLKARVNNDTQDLYLWNLAAGKILPPTAAPTCSKCSQLLVNHLATWSGNTTTINATVLENAISTINGKCGSSFISVTPQHAKSSAASLYGRVGAWGAGVVAVGVGILVQL